MFVATPRMGPGSDEFFWKIEVCGGDVQRLRGTQVE